MSTPAANRYRYICPECKRIYRTQGEVIVCQHFDRAAGIAKGATGTRNIREVIKRIIPLIPADLPEDQSDEDYTELRNDLESCASDWFSASEIEMPLWIGVATSLESWLDKPEPDWPDWKWQVLAIFSGQDEAVLRASLPEEEKAE